MIMLEGIELTIMLERVQSPNLNKATIAFAVAHERHDLLRAIWENPVFPLLCLEDFALFGACSRKSLRFYLETMSGIPDDVLRLWLAAFPLPELGRDDELSKHDRRSLHLWAHVGHYWLRGRSPLGETFALAGSQLMTGIEAARRLQRSI